MEFVNDCLTVDRVAIVAHVVSGQHHQAQTMLTESETPTTWEKTVAAALSVLCATHAQQDTPGQPSPPCSTSTSTRIRPTVPTSFFRVRLGLCVIDLAEGTGIQRVAEPLAGEALESGDACAARDLLAHQECAAQITGDIERTLRAVIETAALDAGVLSPQLQDEHMASVRASETALTYRLQASGEQSRSVSRLGAGAGHSGGSHRRFPRTAALSAFGSGLQRLGVSAGPGPGVGGGPAGAV
jgi:hypothetical protein